MHFSLVSKSPVIVVCDSNEYENIMIHKGKHTDSRIKRCLATMAHPITPIIPAISAGTCCGGRPLHHNGGIINNMGETGPKTSHPYSNMADSDCTITGQKGEKKSLTPISIPQLGKDLTVIVPCLNVFKK